MASDEQIRASVARPPKIYILFVAGILLTFSLAVFTGTLFRWTFIGDIPAMLQQGNIRHAHSHLMFFGWVTLLPFLFLTYEFARSLPAKSRHLYSVCGWLFWLGLATWPAFLLYGYDPVPIGGMRLPFSVMLSGLIMLFWYVFVFYYWLHSRRVSSYLKNGFTHTSILLLLLSSLGAWGVAAVQFMAPHSAVLAKASTHFFLTTFSEGWCMLFGLGVLRALLTGYQSPEPPPNKSEYSGIILIASGSLLLFPYAMGQEFMTPAWNWGVRLATIATLGGYLTLIVAWRHLFRNLQLPETLPLLFLFFKILMLAAALFMPAEMWLGRHQVNIFYLHNSLLGFVSLILIAYLRRQLIELIPEAWLYYVFYFTVFLVWLSLIPMMPGFPVWALGTWIYSFAAYVSPWPGVAALILCAYAARRYYNLMSVENNTTVAR